MDELIRLSAADLAARLSAGDVSSVEVSCVLETRDRQHIEEISGALRAEGIPHTVE